MDSGKLIWATPDGVGGPEALETAAREFGLLVRHCSHARLLDLIRDEGCDLAVIDFGTRAGDGLALLKEVHGRLPRLTIFAASPDGSFEVLRAALEAGAADFFSLPLARRSCTRPSSSSVRRRATHTRDGRRDHHGLRRARWSRHDHDRGQPRGRIAAITGDPVWRSPTSTSSAATSPPS